MPTSFTLPLFVPHSTAGIGGQVEIALLLLNLFYEMKILLFENIEIFYLENLGFAWLPENF